MTQYTWVAITDVSWHSLKSRRKGKPRHTKAPKTEQEGETCEDENEQKYIDLEQEVKEAEPRKNTKNAAEEATETKAEAVRQEIKAEEAEGWTASEASAAPTAAADGQSITKRHAAAPKGTVASEAQEMNEKDTVIRALVQERKTIAEHEKERIREISKKIKKCIRDIKRMKRQKFKKSWRKSKVQGTFAASNQ